MSDERIKEIALRYGYDPQSRQCIEEMAELTQAINKFWRKDLKCGCGVALEEETIDKNSEYYKNLVEEIADVEIMLEQMKEMLFCRSAVEQVKEIKIQRQMNRLKRRENRKNGL